MSKLIIRNGLALLLALAATWNPAQIDKELGNPPVVWHHDIFHADGKPYRQAEVDQIRALTSAAQKKRRGG